MVQEGLRSGKLQPGKTILDSTSGNTGIALALVGSVLRYPVELVLPANVSAERKRIISAYGAKAIYSDPLEGSDGAIRHVPQDFRSRSGEVFQTGPIF